MKKLASVLEGQKPHEALYDLVMFAPEKVYFHVGELASPQMGLQFVLNRYLQYFTFKDRGMMSKKSGGELLTRCDPVFLPNSGIGSAFFHMPMKQMKEMFPVLLKMQLEFIATLNVVRGEYYSINLEWLDCDLDVWSEVRDLLLIHGHLPVNVEIKENAMLSAQVLGMLAHVCEKTHIRIYIDDLCSCYHELPDYEDYFVMIIGSLDRYIKAVKIDYSVMKNILRLEEFHRVRKNLYDFRWLWESYSTQRMPIVIFESMPITEQRWLKRLKELAAGYRGCEFQVG